MRKFPLSAREVRWKLLENSVLDPNTKCWNWAQHLGHNGYGQVNYQCRKSSAHRVAYQVFIGSIPAGMCVLHSCDNRKCVNPDHLFLGTNADNQRDMRAKGRQFKARGEAAGQAKLTETQVKEIRVKRSQGVSNNCLAEFYGVSSHTISQIVQGRIWKHVPFPPDLIIRDWRLRGEENVHAKLREAQILEIRRLFLEGFTRRQLAEMFGVTRYAIASIIRRKTWKHL